MKRVPPSAHFVAGRTCYHADTCEPLVAASRSGEISFTAAAHGGYPGTKLDARVLPEICSVGSWNALHDQAWGLNWHRNEGIEFTFLFSGRLEFAVEDRTHRLRPGHLTITRPWQRHGVGRPHVEASHLAWLILDVGVRRPNQPWRWPDWLILTAHELEQLTTLLRHNEQCVWKVPPDFGALFQKIETLAAAEPRRFDRTRMALAVNELLLAVRDMLAGFRLPLDDRLTSTQRCVELFLHQQLPGLLSEPWSVEAMAKQCGLRCSRFTALCRELTNRSPAQYLLYRRLAEAGRLLRTPPNLTVTDIAHACGFSTSQHFATTFYEHHQMTPTQWRHARSDNGHTAHRGTARSAPIRASQAPGAQPTIRRKVR